MLAGMAFELEADRRREELAAAGCEARRRMEADAVRARGRRGIVDRLRSRAASRAASRAVQTPIAERGRA